MTTQFPSGGAFGYDVAAQSNGGFTVSGATATGNFAVASYTADGSLDPAFSGDGRATANLSAGFDLASAVALQPDGKIVVVGYADEGGSLAMARFDPGGTLDAAFSGDGKLTSDVMLTGSDVAVQDDGGIVVVGQAYDPARGKVDFAVARYGPDGVLDADFGDAGIVNTSLERSDLTDQATAVTLDQQGRILVGGFAAGGGRAGLVRYLPSGVLDRDFGSNGKITAQLSKRGDGFEDLTVANGKIVAAGYASGSFAVVRYRAGGTLDPTFSSDGIVRTSITPGGDVANGIVIDAVGGTIVAAGACRDRNLFCVARYSGAGALDLSFSGDGTTTTNLSSGIDDAEGVIMQSDGSIVVAGRANDAFGVARYQP